MAAAVEVNLRVLARFLVTRTIHAFAPVNEPLAVAFGKNAITVLPKGSMKRTFLSRSMLLGPAVHPSCQVQRLGAYRGP
jgi:hypothetical protein